MVGVFDFLFFGGASREEEQLNPEQTPLLIRGLRVDLGEGLRQGLQRVLWDVRAFNELHHEVLEDDICFWVRPFSPFGFDDRDLNRVATAELTRAGSKGNQISPLEPSGGRREQ
jgi:hypothetical protein